MPSETSRNRDHRISKPGSKQDRCRFDQFEFKQHLSFSSNMKIAHSIGESRGGTRVDPARAGSRGVDEIRNGPARWKRKQDPLPDADGSYWASVGLSPRPTMFTRPGKQDVHLSPAWVFSGCQFTSTWIARLGLVESTASRFSALPHADPMPMGSAVCKEETQCSACEQLPAVENSCEVILRVRPGKEPERVPVEPETPDIAVPAKQPQHIREYYSENIIHPVTILEAEPHDISAERELTRAVILRAFEDSQTDPMARKWFEASQGMMEFWCAVGGLDPGQVRKRAERVSVSRQIQSCNGATGEE